MTRITCADCPAEILTHHVTDESAQAFMREHLRVTIDPAASPTQKQGTPE